MKSPSQSVYGPRPHPSTWCPSGDTLFLCTQTMSSLIFLLLHTCFSRIPCSWIPAVVTVLEIHQSEFNSFVSMPENSFPSWMSCIFPTNRVTYLLHDLSDFVMDWSVSSPDYSYKFYLNINRQHSTWSKYGSDALHHIHNCSTGGWIIPIFATTSFHKYMRQKDLNKLFAATNLKKIFFTRPLQAAPVISGLEACVVAPFAILAEGH